MTATDPTVETSFWSGPAYRARSAHDRAVELKAQYDAEIETRNRAVREAVDGGAPIAKLAPLVGLKRQTIYGILGTAGP